MDITDVRDKCPIKSVIQNYSFSLLNFDITSFFCSSIYQIVDPRAIPKSPRLDFLSVETQIELSTTFILVESLFLLIETQIELFTTFILVESPFLLIETPIGLLPVEFAILSDWTFYHDINIANNTEDLEVLYKQKIYAN